jgi:soluble lytic murein transglycosylase-like protein
VSASYLAEGMDAQANALAARYAPDHTIVPMLDWSAGFSAYRLGQYDQAAVYLERLAQVGSIANRLRAQAAFWAARAHMQAGDPLRVVTLLTAAAREEPTFYGMLAQRMLGQDPRAELSEPVLSQGGLASLMQEPHAHRAVALWQVGETEEIPEEMNRAFAGIDVRLDPEFAALTHDFHLANLELRSSETTARTGKLLTGLFPIPDYQPTGGYTVDPSLVLAFARAESHFRETAGSPVGARGVMQIMPGTWDFIQSNLASYQLNPYSTQDNVNAGVMYLHYLERTMGSEDAAIGAYYQGPNSVRARGLLPETQHYVANVRANANRFGAP